MILRKNENCSHGGIENLKQPLTAIKKINHKGAASDKLEGRRANDAKMGIVSDNEEHYTGGI